ncbi:MAG: TonB-dependent receptor [Verrucomicrobia bacterium]|nr:TonB-dependent receptor [Verrucomicrobiota bacterium]
MTTRNQFRINPRITLQLVAAVMAHGLGLALAAQTNNPPPASAAAGAPAARLPDVVVVGESEYAETVQGPFLPDIQDTRINAGKKTAVLDLDELPKVSNNNYRQALTKTPGLLLSEESSPLVSVGYRGLAPHRAQFTQVLKDGLPIHADPFGYPEAYYTPPLDTVDRIEFLHGGASLMYGPQPGGSLNYVTHRPRTDRPFSARTQHLFGSDNLYSTFNSVDGTIDRVGYYADFNYRTTDGFREANSDFDVYAGSAKLVLDATTDSRWVFSFDGYAEGHGEPGGLAIGSGPDYNVDREATTRFFDRFELERYFASLAWERDFSADTALTVTGWGGYYSRWSKRQRGGGFGTIPTGANANSNTIEHQEFYTEGIEARLRHDWTSGGNTHTLAGGVQLYHTASPRTDERGATPDAEAGQLRNRSQRETLYAPVFLENRFAFEGFSITPGVRLENIYQSVEEEVNVDKETAGTPLGDESQYDLLPLFGVGLEYEFSPKIVGYGNLSQAYRPKIFTEAVPTGGTAVVNSDLEEGTSVQYEIGLRGQPVPWFYWDTSLFWLDLDNQIGSVAVPGGTSIENVGHAVHRGWEGTLELELLALARALRGEPESTADHRLSLYGNALLLDAEFTGGPREGLTPQYAPDYLFRAGAIYRWRDRGKLALTGTFVDDHYADDANSDNFFVPAYMVWDLTLDWKVYRDRVSILAGINNLFDEDYYARIRGDGIDPAYGRNFYAGFSLAF